MKLLSINSDAKTRKGVDYGILTGVLYLAPSDTIAGRNTCPHASAGCRASCLFTAGRGAFSNVQKARINKTLWFFSDRAGFLNQIEKDIVELKQKAHALGLRPAVRLNGTSDIGFESIARHIMEKYSDVAFYDYTKSPVRFNAYLSGKAPANYHLTFSKSESNTDTARELAGRGGNIAVVFSGDLPDTFWGRPVIDGDLNDARFTDASGVIVGLKAKGKARQDTSGFVVHRYAPSITPNCSSHDLYVPTPGVLRQRMQAGVKEYELTLP
jgi:hypothetical protein